MTPPCGVYQTDDVRAREKTVGMEVHYNIMNYCQIYNLIFVPQLCESQY